MTSLSGNVAAGVAKNIGVFSIPFQSSAREKIRGALAYQLINAISPALGYYNQFKACFVEETSFEQVAEYPSVQATWGVEVYDNRIDGGGSFGAYHKQATIDLRVFLSEAEPETLSSAIERVAADLENFFAAHVQMKDASGNPTCYSCILESNTLDPSSMRLQPQVVDFSLSIFYRTSLTDPRQLL